MEYCPKCSEKLEVNWQAGHPDVMEGKMKINCLRCQVPMSMKGKFKFHAGTHLGPVERPFEIWINRVPFDLYFCPKCGKIEFFLPDEKNAF
jgi:DNA-directed RNA polymerase subunit RPC12/RpoP